MASKRTTASKKEPGVLACNHTCPETDCKSVEGVNMFAKAGGITRRHAKNANKHPKCAPPCPAHPSMGILVRQVRRSEWDALLPSLQLKLKQKHGATTPPPSPTLDGAPLAWKTGTSTDLAFRSDSEIGTNLDFDLNGNADKAQPDIDVAMGEVQQDQPNQDGEMDVDGDEEEVDVRRHISHPNFSLRLRSSGARC